jgi:hypothetical protein
MQRKSRNKCLLLSSAHIFNIIQSHSEKLILLNLQGTNPVEDLGIATVDLQPHLKELYTTDPCKIRTGADLDKF